MNTPVIERRVHPRADAPALMRLKDVMRVSGLSRATLYRQVQAGTFPQPVKIGGRASAWVRHEVEGWITRRMRERVPRKSSAR